MRKRAWLVASMVAMVSLAQPALAQRELQQRLLPLPPLLGKPTVYHRKGTESIYSIARRYGVGTPMVFNANLGDLRAGNEVLVIPTEHIPPVAKATGLVVNLPERGVYVYRNGRAVTFFPIAIGMRGWETPTGDFHVANKRRNPTWFPPKWAVQEEPVPPGPKNPLGDRWMGLSIPGYGLHATNAPATIGRFASHGCMRMYPEHARALYDMVKTGTPVKITYQVFALGYQPEEGIVYLVHHPDPYQLGDTTVAEVQQALADYGLADVADLEAVAETLARPQGVPTAVVGSEVKVTVGGQPVSFALRPTRAGNDWLVPVGPLAEAIGAQYEIGQGGSYVTLARGTQRLLLSLGNSQALLNGAMIELEVPMRVAAGYPMVPLKATATVLGASVGWNEDDHTILIWNSPGPGSLDVSRR